MYEPPSRVRGGGSLRILGQDIGVSGRFPVLKYDIANFLLPMANFLFTPDSLSGSLLW